MDLVDSGTILLDDSIVTNWVVALFDIRTGVTGDMGNEVQPIGCHIVSLLCDKDAKWVDSRCLLVRRSEVDSSKHVLLHEGYGEHSKLTDVSVHVPSTDIFRVAHVEDSHRLCVWEV